MVKKWIQGIREKKGALHKQLGYSPKEKLPGGLLKDIRKANIGTHVRGHKVTPLLKKRAVLAINFNKIK